MLAPRPSRRTSTAAAAVTFFGKHETLECAKNVSEETTGDFIVLDIPVLATTVTTRASRYNKCNIHSCTYAHTTANRGTSIVQRLHTLVVLHVACMLALGPSDTC